MTIMPILTETIGSANLMVNASLLLPSNQLSFFWGGTSHIQPETACGRGRHQEPPKEVPDEQIWQAFTEGVGGNPVGWPDVNGWTT